MDRVPFRVRAAAARVAAVFALVLAVGVAAPAEAADAPTAVVVLRVASSHGMTPAAALHASSAAATLLGLDRSIGTLEAGNDAATPASRP